MPKSVDINQPEIVAALRAVGATVQHLHEVGRGCPDILVGLRGKNYVFEIKNPDQRWSLTVNEQAWFIGWQGQADFIETAEDALQIMGAL